MEKNMKGGEKKAEIAVPRFTDNINLCPVLCLEEYLRRTQAYRKDVAGALFLALRTPYQVVSVDSVRRWLRALLEESGIATEVFKVHSIRSAASSKALGQGVPIDTILSTANWSSTHTFVKFYRRDINTEMASKILASK
jgi:hypothetical protein